MKTNGIKKSISLLLAVIMVIMVIPFGSISVSALSESGLTHIESTDENDYGLLGWTFNALSDDELSATGFTSSSIFNSATLDAYVLGDGSNGVMSQEANVIYESSAQEMMKKLGIDYSSTKKADVGIKKAKVGFESKFGLGIDYKTTEKVEEFLYYYSYRAICEQYRVKNTSDYSSMLSNTFLNTVKSLNYENANSLASFYELYGTHVLIQYDKGAEMVLTAAAVSTSKEVSLDTTLSVSASASASASKGKLSASAESAQSVEVAFSSMNSESGVDAKTYWTTIGGDSAYCNNYTGSSITINEAGVEAWVASIAGENGNSVFLPETSKWVAIWEVLPNTVEYASIKQALYEYYMEKATTLNSEFFSKYCTYSNLVSIPSYEYVNPNGYVTTITDSSFDNSSYLPVAPGSSVSFPLACEGYDITYKITDGEEYATTDRFGTVKINGDALLNETITLTIYLNGTASHLFKMRIQNEGDSIFDGGYGTSERPYLISTKTQLAAISQYANNAFLLTEDVDYESASWTPFAFAGILDGGGHCISNLKITATGQYVGFFTQLNGGTVQNLNFDSVAISVGSWWTGYEYNYFGVVAGYVNETAKIYNCSVANSSIWAYYNRSYNLKMFIGGICGWTKGNVQNCSVINTSLKGKACGDATRYDCFLWIGGISGYVDTATGVVDSCSSYDNTIYGYIYTNGYKKEKDSARAYFYMGGLVGELYNSGTLKSSYYYNNSRSYDREFYDHTGWNDTDYNPTYVYSNACVGSTQSSDLSTANLENSSKSTQTRKVSNIIVSNTKSQYCVGDFFDMSALSINGVYDNNTAIGGVNHFTVTGFDSSVIGQQDITVTYNYGDTSITKILSIEIVAIQINELLIANTPAQTQYYVGDTSFNRAGLELIAVYNNGDVKVVTDYSVVGFDTSTENAEETITFSYEGKTATIIVSVVEVTPFKIEMFTQPNKVNYAEGDSFNAAGCSIKVFYNNGTTSIVDADLLSFNGYDESTCGQQNITVSYKGLTTNFEVSVGSVSSIQVVAVPNKETYYVGDSKLDTEGLVIRVTYENGVIKDISSGFTVSKLQATSRGYESITVSYGSATDTFDVYIEEVKLAAISLNRLGQTEYYVGDTFSLSGLVVEATFNNGKTKDIPYQNCEILVDNKASSALVLTSAGDKIVTVDYVEAGVRVQTSYKIHVNTVEITHIEISSRPAKTNYKPNEALSTGGMVVSAVYNNGSTQDITAYVDSYVYDFTSPGVSPVVVWYNGLSAEFNVMVAQPISIAITSLPNKMEYIYGESIDIEGLEVTSYYADGSSIVIDDYNLNAPTALTPTDNVISVTYLDRSAAFDVLVSVPTIKVISEQTVAGSTVEVAISVENNPGILGASFTVAYNENITLISAQSGDAWSSLTYTAPGVFTSPCTFGWDGLESEDDTDGTILTLTFKVADTAEIGDDFEISITYGTGDIFDEYMNPVDLAVVNGSVSIIDYTPGDINEDGVINMQDVVLLRRYVVGGYSVSLNAVAADVNRDGALNMQDVVLIRRYVVGGYNVELQ